MFVYMCSNDKPQFQIGLHTHGSIRAQKLTKIGPKRAQILVTRDINGHNLVILSPIWTNLVSKIIYSSSRICWYTELSSRINSSAFTKQIMKLWGIATLTLGELLKFQFFDLKS